MKKSADKMSTLISIYLVTFFAAGISLYTYLEYSETGRITTAHGQQAEGIDAAFITYGLAVCSFVLVIISLYKTLKVLAAPPTGSRDKEERSPGN